MSGAKWLTLTLFYFSQHWNVSIMRVIHYCTVVILLIFYMYYIHMYYILLLYTLKHIIDALLNFEYRSGELPFWYEMDQYLFATEVSKKSLSFGRMSGFEPFIIVNKLAREFLLLGSNLNLGEWKSYTPRGERWLYPKEGWLNCKRNRLKEFHEREWILDNSLWSKHLFHHHNIFS